MKEYSKYIEAIIPVHQGGTGYCGPASLEIALRAVGIEISQDDVAKGIQNIEDGMSWEEMEETVRSCGCSVFCDRESSFEHLSEVFYETGLPIVVAWMSDRDGTPGAHFSVVKQISGEMITLADPQYEDFVMYSKKEFEKRWADEETERAYMVIFPEVIGEK